MKHWIIGIVLAVVAVALLYGAAATSQTTPLGSPVMLLASVAAALGIFATIHAGTRHRASSAAHAAAGAETASPASDPTPWAGTGRTLGVSLIGVVALLVYVGIYVGAWANVVAWIIPIFVCLTAVILGTLVVLTAGKTE